MRVDVELKEVFSHYFIDLTLILFYLVLDSDALVIAILVENAPDFLNLSDPDLMGCVRGQVRRASLLTSERHQMLQSSHVVLIDLLTQDSVGNFHARQLFVNSTELRAACIAFS